MSPGSGSSRRRVRRAAALLLAATVLLGAEDGCANLVSLLAIMASNTATITVENLSDETLFVVLSTDDAYSGRSLGPGGRASITTHKEGTYHVVVRTNDDALAGYGARVNELQQLTRDFILFPSRAIPTDVKRKIDELKQKLKDFRRDASGLGSPSTAASCSGGVVFPDAPVEDPQPVRKSAQILRGPDGSLVASCG